MGIKIISIFCKIVESLMEQSKACSLCFCKYSIYISSSRIAYLKKKSSFFFFNVNACMCVQYISMQKPEGHWVCSWFLVRQAVQSWVYRIMRSCQAFYVGDGIQTQVLLTLPTEQSPSSSSSGYQKRVITSYSRLWPGKCCFSCIRPTLPSTKGLSFF